MIRFAKHWLPITLLATALAAGPVFAAQTWVANALHEDFEGYALGPQSFSFCGQPGDDCLGVLSGGSVMTATGDLPAASGNQVYAGTSLSFAIPEPDFYAWPALSFSLSTGDSPVIFTLYDFDNGLEFELFSLEVPAMLANEALGVGSEGNTQYFSRFTLQSASQFAIDDLVLGLEGVPPAVPEPASWLMMIIGFGVVGVTLRRRVHTSITNLSKGL